MEYSVNNMSGLKEIFVEAVRFGDKRKIQKTK